MVGRDGSRIQFELAPGSDDQALLGAALATGPVREFHRIEPTLFGFPFFYWFQLAWIFVSMIITAAVYYATEPRV